MFISRVFRGGEFGAYNISPVLFLRAVGFLPATKTLHKRKEKRSYDLKVKQGHTL